MENLKVLYLNPNEICKKIRHYRKTIIYNIKLLTFLDDRPVDEKERIFCNVFNINLGFWLRRN